MSDNVIQTSFNSGEWSPSLYAQVNLKQYHSGAALLRNFFVDTRGGATTRPGTRYVATCKSNGIVRVIPFQASFTVSYLLEFGNGYLRFYNNGAPVLEAGKTITAITQANPGVVTSAAHGFSNGDWVFISGVVGMTQLNGNTYIVAGAAANTFTLTDLFGNAVNTTGFGAYVSGGLAQRVYTIVSPYQASEVFGIRYTQNVNQLVLCHPNYPPYVLTLIAATNWTLAAIVFGSTLATPVISGVGSTLAGGNASYSYRVTAVDANGQESAPSNPNTIGGLQDLRTTAGTNSITVTALAGAVSYNVYKAEIAITVAVPSGTAYGFIGNMTGVVFIDSNIQPDFSQSIPIVSNPFQGSGVVSITLGARGTYTSVPTLTLTAAPVGGTTATAVAYLSVASLTISAGGFGYIVGNTVRFPNGVVTVVTSITAGGVVDGLAITNPGLILSGAAPTNPVSETSSGSGFGCKVNLTWQIDSLILTSSGTGYLVAPSVAFSGGGGATATTTLGAASAGNPTVPALANQRLVLAGPVGSPGQINASQPGAYFNYNISDPIVPDDAIQQTLVAGQLNTIQSMIPMPAGLVVFGDRLAWLVNGGSSGSPFSATLLVANPQAYNGASPLPPIVAASDILYVQAKQSIVRNLVYNFYTNVYTGTDISILSNHLFYGFNLIQWAWAEEPFKLAWAVRNDGQLLCLTFLKDLEIIAWTHSDTQGTFKSIASLTEFNSAIGNVDAVYHVVQRQVQGVAVNYIERFVELTYPADYRSSWQVDAGIGYNGAAAVTFSGAQHLGGQVVTGLADGVVINFTMPTSGTFVFGGGGTPGLTAITNASIVTVGLSFLPQLGTLPLDLGEPTTQGKRKKVSAVTLRVRNALGLTAGRNLDTGVVMQDLVLGNVGTMSNQIVTGLVTGDTRTIVDPQWDVFGQYYIQQPNPYPASILGVIPEIELGDAGK